MWDLGISSIKELEVERGILASERDELYGCIFGRDSLITAQGRERPWYVYSDGSI